MSEVLTGRNGGRRKRSGWFGWASTAVELTTAFIVWQTLNWWAGTAVLAAMMLDSLLSYQMGVAARQEKLSADWERITGRPL